MKSKKSKSKRSRMRRKRPISDVIMLFTAKNRELRIISKHESGA